MKSQPIDDVATARLEIRIPPGELQTLDAYCKRTKRTRADVLREFIRSLDAKKR